MREFIFTKFKFQESYLYILILITFLIIALYHLNSGIYMSSDSHRFSRWADELIKFNFNFFDFYSIDRASHRPHLFFFSVPVFLIALCKVVFGDGWQSAFLLLNLSFLLISLLIFAKGLLIIGIRPILISLSLPFIIISADILTWPRYILSDMNYALIVVIATYCIIKTITINKISYIQIFLIIFLLLASRPSSIPVIFAVIFFIILSKHKLFLRQRNILLLIFIIFISIPIVLGSSYFLIEFNFNKFVKVKFLINMVKEGMIIHDRPETWVDVPQNFLDVLYIYFLRLINFFNPYASNFSILHITLNVIQTVVIIFSIFIWSLYGGHSKLYDKLFFFIIILSLSVAAFHSFILIDYDWRYRFPIILPLIMLFPVSLEILLRKNIKQL